MGMVNPWYSAFTRLPPGIYRRLRDNGQPRHQGRGVITSYSIHYTKLYELLDAKAQRAEGTGGRIRRLAERQTVQAAEALAAADPAKIVPGNLPEPPKGRTLVVGAGKAGA